MHGFCESSSNFIMNGEKSIAFILASQGYDVWLNNMRGNKFSLGHETLDYRKDLEFWKGALTFRSSKFDVPALI